MDLARKIDLKVVSDLLEERNSKLTITKISNTLEYYASYISELVKFASDNGYFKILPHNYVELIKPYDLLESDYYDFACERIRDYWNSQGYSQDAFFIENTSKKKPRIVGRWTTPDLTLVCHKKFPWVLGSEFDVVTFEVKKPNDCNVLAVFEALSHSSSATKSYVVFPISRKSWEQSNPEHKSRVYEECSKHGIGLFFIDPEKPEKIADHFVTADRFSIDNEKCSNFIDAVFSNDFKAKISTWK